MKYSINSSGYIVAERDIYSLGGFIPKGSVGAKVANEDQISQDGECWLASGNISARPDVRIKDNAYIGNWFASSTALHAGVITEISGNTLIPGTFVSRSPAADTRNNFFAKDSFIGVSMDVLCGPAATTTAFPFEQGLYSVNSAAGTLFANMVATPVPANSCRGSVALRLGKETKIYVPVGLRCQVLWGYYNTAGQEAYSGRRTEYTPGLHTISDPVYGIARLHFWRGDGNAMTPADLLATGAKILGHIGSPLIDMRPESVSGGYVMDNSSFVVTTNNFSLVTVQLRFLAGGLYNTNMYTKTDRPDYKPYGTFRNVERLEYAKYLPDSHRTAATRDTYISAYDCPLLRVDDYTYAASLESTGNLVLRRCIVPKAEFQNDVINGNTYEDIDFSYANEDLGYVMTGYTRFISSHKQGIYRLSGGPSSVGFVSHKGNLADTARLYQAEKYIPLDGSIVEQGAYGAGGLGSYYESSKTDSPIRIRTGKPLPTFGLVFPSLPAGYSVKALYYLDEDFVIRSTVADPTELATTYPYVVMMFRKDDDSAINVTDFIALNTTLRMIDHTKAPEITGSAYVGAGCTVRGDVKLIGDPYVNRVFDVNQWERGTGGSVTGETWVGLKVPESVGYPRLRTRDVFPVDTTVDNNFTCASGYRMIIYYFGEDGKCSGWSPWGTSLTVSDPAAAYISLLVSKTNGTDFIDESDIPLANVKYVRAFKKRRYITNELDRTSPEDTSLAEDQWRVASINTGADPVGKLYKDLIVTSDRWCILKRPFNMGSSWTIRVGDSVTYAANALSWDALTKLLGTRIKDGVALTGLELGKKNGYIVTLLDVPAARIVLEFVPSPRIVVPYGSSTLFISGPKIRVYDNAVLSRNLNQEGEIILSGDAVMGYDFNSGSCMCSNGRSDAIIKLP